MLSAIRRLRRAPTVAVCAVLCLALGLGATIAIASAINQALLRPLPFRDPGRLVTVYRTEPTCDNCPFSAPKYLDLARGSRQIQMLAATAFQTKLLSVGTEAAQVRAYRITGNMFPMLGVRPFRGRLIDVGDDSVSRDNVVVMSYELWRDRFAGDPTLVGRTIRLDGVPHTVIGIAPSAFHIPHGNQNLEADLWLPMRFTADERASRGHNFLKVQGRLAPGATVANATSDVRSLMDQMIALYPHMKGESAFATPLQADSVRLVRTPLLLIFGAVCAVLLIAAANVGSLLLARGVNRRREMAVRSAIGASRWDLMQPVIAESAVLAGLGGVLGIGLAWLAVRTIGSLAGAQVPQLVGLGIEIRVMLFAILLSTVVALICGMLPAWHSASVDPQDALRGGRGGGSGLTQQRLLAGLVVGEVALSLTLLIGASLVLRGFEKLVSRDPGFDPTRLLSLTAVISPDRYASGEPIRRFLTPAIDAIERIPGVQGAGAISAMPYHEWGDNSTYRYEGTPDDPEHEPVMEDRDASPDFFRATGQQLVAGRLLRADDDNRPDVPLAVVVNRALARRDFPNGDALGKRFYWGPTRMATIVGVVSDIANFGPVDPPHPEVYWSYAQTNNDETVFPILVRIARGDPASVAPAVREAIRSVDPAAAVADVQPMAQRIGRSVGAPRFYLSLIATFAIVAIVLAVAGLYGVMSYTVAQRTREMGIRSALGSTSGRTLRLVAEQGMRIVGLGLVLGVLGGALVTRALESLLYGVSRADPITWVGATAALAIAGLVASLVPATRATLVDPVTAIRTD
ncbi:MAG TPA: ABC transporter permease [Gemmatimonadaceae bacterium]|nr:ABC transporter permease [Gemmatimonadaceae bacterium]